MNESQVASHFNSVVLKKIGKWTIERTEKSGMVISDGWLTNWIIEYGDGTWAGDDYIRNKAIIKWLDNNI